MDNKKLGLCTTHLSLEEEWGIKLKIAFRCVFCWTIRCQGIGMQLFSQPEKCLHNKYIKIFEFYLRRSKYVCFIS